MTYIAPQTFREWHPIGIYKSIDKSKPFVFNLGTLPLLLWFNNNNNNPNIIINSCKHLGNSLNKAKINNNCLICPFHSSNYNESDNIGSSVVHNGLIWWSYKSYYKSPYLKLNKESYQLQIDINIDLISFILNSLVIANINNLIWNKNKKQLLLKNENMRVIFKYPYQIIRSDKRFGITEELSILPLSINKLRLFINIYNINPVLIPFIHLYYRYMKYKYENEISSLNINIKNYFIFKTRIDKDNYLETVYKSYDNYMFLTDFTINHFLINMRYY